MTQQPLTQAGAQAKQNELYALPDDQLITQANFIRSDFANWIKNNFILSAAQSSFLDGINTEWIQLAAANTGCAVQNRLSITLNAPPVPPQYKSKLVKHSSILSASIDTQGNLLVTGSLTFDISYTI